MKSILLEKEFGGWFKEILFAVYSNDRVGQENNAIFTEVMATRRVLFTGSIGGFKSSTNDA